MGPAARCGAKQIYLLAQDNGPLRPQRRSTSEWVATISPLTVNREHSC
jgi:hypothetical protein